MSSRPFDWPMFALLVFIGVLFVIFSRSYQGIAVDGPDYYVQTRSIVIDRDLTITPDEIQLGAARGDARYYPIGTALLWTPFVAVCHLLLGLNIPGGPYVRDGFDPPYTWAVGLATFAYGAVALVLIARVARVYFSRWLAVAATIAVCAGSFLVWYIAIEASASHGASLFAVTLFLYLWHQTRTERGWREWLAIGAAAGLMSVVRWQDCLFALVLLPDLIRDYWLALRRKSSIPPGQLVRNHLVAALGAVVLLVPQFWLWHSNTVQPAALPYRMFRVRWFEVDAANVLFSPNHGLFVWTPILYAAVVGLVLFLGREPRVASALAVCIAGQVYANSILQVWWGGSGFGARRFAGCALAFTIGFAAFIDWFRRRPTAFIGTVMAAAIAVNVALMQDIYAGRVPIGEGLTAGALLRPIYDRIGNPFSAPASLLFSWRYGVSPARYDALGERVHSSLFLDVGEADDEPFLTRGWWEREREQDTSFRWAVGGVSEVAMPLRERDDFRLQFRAEPFAPPGWAGLSVTVSINGNAVGDLDMQPGWHDYVVTVPPEVLDRNLNLLQFRFSRVLSPLAAALSDDERELTARFDRILMLRDF